MMPFYPEIDRLATCRECSFALFRLPGEDEPVLVLQAKGLPLVLTAPEELDGKRGFVISPFHISKDTPLLLIRPDITVRGYDRIVRVCRQLETADPSGEEIHSGTPGEPVASSDVYETYMRTFRSFIVPLQRKELDKLVLSRTLIRERPASFSPAASFAKACDSYPSAFVYLCRTPLSGIWTGSSPEVLLSGRGTEWQTVALAGTVNLHGKTPTAGWNEKNYSEQKYVSDYIREQLSRSGIECMEDGPYTVCAGNVAHLQSGFRFRLDNTGKLGSLIRLLHPTPAICGLPKEDAYRFILGHEGYDRRYYSGYTGWLDPEGRSDIYVNLRCMEIHARTLTLYAGGGILPASEAIPEWNETEAKLQTMLSII